MSECSNVKLMLRPLKEIVFRVIFKSVFGWHENNMTSDECIKLIGIDNSSLSVAVNKCYAARPKGVVILCHPFTKYGMSYFFKKKYHKWLVHAGYHVVGFNFKGFGSSTIEGFLFYDDVSSVAIWAKHEFPSVPIHLFGASFGAFQAIHAIARKKLEISSCVFDSVPASIGVFFGSGLMGIIMRQLSNGRYAQITGTNDIFSSIPLPNNIPCLYLYGDQDIHISSSEIEKVRATCGGKNVVMFANCGHLDIKKHYASEYANIVTKFFDAHSDAMASSIINHNT